MMLFVLGGDDQHYITDVLDAYPNKRESIPMEQVHEMRRKLGYGVNFCMQFLKKTDTVDEAISLCNRVLLEAVKLQEKKEFEEWKEQGLIENFEKAMGCNELKVEN